jgi:Kef-type K+ transport system membrane component KefB
MTSGGLQLLVSVGALAGLWIFTRLASNLFCKIKCPELLGAMLAGVIVGPGGLGLVDVVVHHGPQFGALLKSVYWMGLIALMFTTGTSLPTEGDSKVRPAIAVLVGATLIAFILAFTTAGLISANHSEPGISRTPQGILAYEIILAAAAVVTSVPFLSKIFQNVGLLNTHFAKRILVSACILDLILWNFVSLADAVRNSNVLSAYSAIKPLVLTGSFSALVIYYGPRLSRIVVKRLIAVPSIWRVTIFVLAFCGTVVGLGMPFGVNPMIAAILAGYCVGHLRAPISDELSIIEKYSNSTLVILYFAIVGLSVDIIRDGSLGLIIGFLVWSSILKIACIFFAAKLYFGDSALSIHYAVTMNTRGGPGIALAGLALGAGLIGQPTFLALIFASFATAGVTEAWLMIFYRGSRVPAPSITRHGG